MKRIGVLVVLTFVFFVTAQAKSDPDHLDAVGKSLIEEITKEMPGWTHRSIQPIEGSKHVIIQHWELADMLVKIAVMESLKLDQAENSFKESKSHFRVEEEAARSQGRELRLIKEDLSTLGDEGYVTDRRGSEAVAFRKGKFIVNVSVVRPENNQDVFFSRKFAECVAKVLELQ